MLVGGEYMSMRLWSESNASACVVAMRKSSQVLYCKLVDVPVLWVL